jgi:flagellar basal-body rod protein FlgB
MGPGALPLLAALTEKMKWHQARQGVLAENVANSDTPGFRARDLKTVNFSDQMRVSQVRLATTRSDHIVATTDNDRASTGFRTDRAEGYELTPEGNGVVLETEMMKVAANQMDYQTITTLYSRSLRLIRTALGRQV